MELVSVRTLARELGVGAATVYQWCDVYGLPHYRPPVGGLRIDHDEFVKWFGQFKSKRGGEK
jgi:excisionase family DNA binding protein